MSNQHTHIFPLRKSSRVEASDVNKSGRLSLSGMAKKFQEAAWEHAAELDYGYHNLAEKQLTWVLSRMLIKIHKYPRWNREIAVRTWPSDMKKLFFIRDFEFRNTDAHVVIAGTSSWLIVNDKGRPQIPDHACDNIPLKKDERSLFRNPSKIPLPTEYDRCFKVAVRYSDLDMNNHTSNVRYFAWIADCLAQKGVYEDDISLVEINFLKECKLDDVLDICYSLQHDNTHVVTGINQDGKYVFAAKAGIFTKH
jgi:medium-chain acyl-[acyl-carrier-protein] hydrolase